jgi:ABC-2 type transport system ATP-binding protein
MNAILVVTRLEKRYGALRALDGLSFSVAEGEVFALLGPNGAGKTTALEIVEGIRIADGGSVSVCGVDALSRPDMALRHLGVQLQTQGLPASMTVSEALEFFSLYRRRKPRPGVLERFGLAAKRRAAYGSLSMGLQRRLMLALAVAHDPEILVLDEPTASLDVESRNALHELIREEKAKGVTVILASHDMAEVEKLADRAAVLVRGRLAAVGSPRQLTSQGDTQTRLSVLTRNGSLAGGIAGATSSFASTSPAPSFRACWPRSRRPGTRYSTSG